MIRNAVLIAGPTASGKSGLAVEIAHRIGGVIVNADSMQVYSVLRVLTARPDAKTTGDVPHRLYGHVHPAEPYSTGAWLRDVAALAQTGAFDDRRPIFVGGTGLYFRALTQGLADMPSVPRAVRERWRERLASEGPAALHLILQARDPAAAASIRPSDGQRIVRALEVVEASGRRFSDLREASSRPLVDVDRASMIVLAPDREVLRSRIRRRVMAMVEEGALDEVKALHALRLDVSSPALKAIGYPQFARFLEGGLDLSEAIDATAIATAQYAKRQSTWFRNQFDDRWASFPDPAAALHGFGETGSGR